ncbi:MAG TPA: FAD binding domain-containing protein [Acetobacteraceae bacterium]|nr:FAD binding domain-containing protein [Acetobacteraceae bacterium]
MAFAVHRPESVPAAVAALAGSGRVAVSGGTLAVGAINAGRSFPSAIVSLRRAGLSGVTREGETIEIGAATPIADLACPDLTFLDRVLGSFGSPTLRNMATLGGNLFAPQPYGDFGVALLALDASLTVAGPQAARRLPLSEFYTAGIASDEIVTGIRFDRPAPGTWRWLKATRRALNSAAVIAVGAVLETDGAGKISAVRVALGGVAPHPVRSPAAEAALAGRTLDAVSATRAAEEAAAAHPCFTDAYASAWYRRRVLPVFLRRALLET